MSHHKEVWPPNSESSYLWKEAFKYAVGFDINDISECLAQDWISNQYYADDDVIAVFKLKNGQCAALRASSDSSGWG